jgi:hypothetical protein
MIHEGWAFGQVSLAFFSAKFFAPFPLGPTPSRGLVNRICCKSGSRQGRTWGLCRSHRARARCVPCHLRSVLTNALVVTALANAKCMTLVPAECSAIDDGLLNMLPLVDARSKITRRRSASISESLDGGSAQGLFFANTCSTLQSPE